MRLYKSFFILLLSVSQCLFSYSQSSLNTEVGKLKADKSLQHASWSICVLSALRDTTIYEHNSHLSLVPASTLKTITTGAALAILGTEFKFKTKIQYSGLFDILTGTINGDIYIIGGGDPTLDSKYFSSNSTLTDKWAAILKNKGIKTVTGKVIADARIFEKNTIPSQWIWSDIGNYFGAGASGLSYHDNSYTVHLNSGILGTKTTIAKTSPYISNLNIHNNVVARGRKDSAYIYGAPYSYHRIIEGSIPPNRNNFKVKGSIPDPALFCAQELTKSLTKAEISVSGKATTVRILKESKLFTKTSTQKLHTHLSPNLEKIVYWCNLKSINLYAEHLLKYIAYNKIGVGTEQAGTKVIIDYWKSKGVDISGWTMHDGSGLSRSNIITTKTQAEILRAISNEKTFSAFYNSLPIAGKSGSLYKMCKGSLAENNLRAKSGYLTLARGYTGYVKNKNGELLCFSVLANNYECSPAAMRRRLERILIAIADL